MPFQSKRFKQRVALQRYGPPEPSVNPYADASAYRTALEQGAYRDAGAQYGAGLDRLSNQLAGAGPNADSGAANAYRYKLASSIYGNAISGVNKGYAGYLGQALGAQRQYNYTRQLMQYQKKLNKRSTWADIMGILGGVGGAVAGGPAGAAAGYGIGSGAINDKFGSTE